MAKNCAFSICSDHNVERFHVHSLQLVSLPPWWDLHPGQLSHLSLCLSGWLHGQKLRERWVLKRGCYLFVICGRMKSLIKAAAHKLLFGWICGWVIVFRNQKHLVIRNPSLAGLLCHWCITKGLAVTRLMRVVWKQLRPAACCLPFPSTQLVFGWFLVCLDRLTTDTWAHAKDLKTQWKWSSDDRNCRSAWSLKWSPHCITWHLLFCSRVFAVCLLTYLLSSLKWVAARLLCGRLVRSCAYASPTWVFTSDTAPRRLCKSRLPEPQLLLS